MLFKASLMPNNVYNSLGRHLYLLMMIYVEINILLLFFFVFFFAKKKQKKHSAQKKPFFIVFFQRNV